MSKTDDTSTLSQSTRGKRMHRIGDSNRRGDVGRRRSTATAIRIRAMFLCCAPRLDVTIRTGTSVAAVLQQIAGSNHSCLCLHSQGCSRYQHRCDRATTTEGWWHIDPGKCLKVSEVDAKAVWLYDHVITKDGRSGGNLMLFVKSHADFKVDQHFGKACQAGWNSRGFERNPATRPADTLRSMSNDACVDV